MKIIDHLSDEQRGQLGRFSPDVQCYDSRERCRAMTDAELTDYLETIALNTSAMAGGAESAARELAICTAEALRRLQKPTKKDKP